MSLAGNALRPARDGLGRSRKRQEALAQVLDRPALEGARPRENVERGYLDVAAGGDRLEGCRLRLADPLDADDGVDLGKVGEHRSAQRGIVAALGQRPREDRLDLVVAEDHPVREQQVRANARRSGWQRFDLGLD